MIKSKVTEIKSLITENYIQQAQDELDNLTGIANNATSVLENFKLKIDDPEMQTWIDGFISEYLS